MKIKILYVVSTLKQTGPTNQMFGILKYLNREKFEPFIVSLSPEPSNSMIGIFKDLNIPIYTLGLSRIKGQFFGKGLLNKTLNKIRPDIIHTQGIRPDVLVHGLKSSTPQILSLRNYPFDDYPAKFGNFAGRLMAQSHFKVISKSKHAVLCSKSLSEIYRKKHQLNLDFIQNGVNIEKYHPIPTNEKPGLKAKLGLQRDKSVIISVGSLIPRKCTEVAIEGFLKSSVKDECLFLIAGDGPEREKLEAIADNNPAILFLGEINNIKEYLQVSDVFVSVSYSEGLPNTVMEAMACRLPVILTRILPHTELVGVGYPFLTSVKNSTEVSEQLDKILKIDFNEIGTELMQAILTNFTAKIMSNKYQQYYRKVIHE